ncbi:transcriptional regulator NarP [Aquimixticola soesokkakensis]|uniref:Transcriptional regulator NarP n=1 Tax=Aquimixticola soesokkakensis TaxID=1519096 RepID=A0A1Y5T4B0_9RHOB|nr:helix-turn-helix transcriptional regulator [Aquimixticola soesokkakensis]SLN55049.1 transcriptional regulator NarP [Aquimixticola soesokkakensis]
MTQRVTLPAGAAFGAPAETLAMACLDVDPASRIVFCDATARRFLDRYPQHCDSQQRFQMSPPAALDAALWTACRPVAPDATIFSQGLPHAQSVIQINVLPFQPERARILVFWDDPDTGQARDLFPALTAREYRVLELAASGLRRDRIGHQLNISLPTVDLHCRNLRRKLSALTMSEAVAVALRYEILPA